MSEESRRSSACDESQMGTHLWAVLRTQFTRHIAITMYERTHTDTVQAYNPTALASGIQTANLANRSPTSYSHTAPFRRSCWMTVLSGGCTPSMERDRHDLK